MIIVDDDSFARRSLREGLQEAGLVVIAEAATGREGVALARHYRPEVVLMDLVMPGVDGVAATRELHQEAPEVRVLLLTSSDDVELGLLGLRAGASGHIVKDADLAALVHAVRVAAAGDPVLSPGVATRLLEQLRALPAGGRGIRPVRSPLTAREWEVLDMLCGGSSTTEIADELVLSVDTVRTHVKRILRKLGVRSQAEAIRAANEMRSVFTPPDSA